MAARHGQTPHFLRAAGIIREMAKNPAMNPAMNQAMNPAMNQEAEQNIETEISPLWESMFLSGF